MCCIFGVGFLRDHKATNKDLIIGLVSKLAKEAEGANRASTGISIMREKTHWVMKRPLPASSFVKSDDYQNFMDEHVSFDEENDVLMSIIGHTRLPTKGTAANNANNHPIITRNITGVHNGIIANDDELFDVYKREFQRIAMVDSEIIFQLIAFFAGERERNTIDAISDASKLLRGSYACAVHNTCHPYNLYLFRRSNPIRIMLLKELGLILFATREHFINKAIDMLDDEPETEEMELLSGAGVSFNLYERTYNKFLLTED